MTRITEIALRDSEVPSLNTAMDISTLALTPKEGFVLSRVDGKTSISEISQICGLPMEEVFAIFRKFLFHGAVKIKASDEKKTKERVREKLTIIEQLDEDEKYDTLKAIPREDRKKILLAEEDMEGRNFYEIFGLDKNASDEQVKKAYFKMTKEFHPDKYFNRELGIYKRKLETIFQKITEMFETLTDADKRREYNAKIFPADPKIQLEQSKDDKRPRPKTLIEKLAEGKKFFAMGEAEYKKGNIMSANSYFKMALSYDPANKSYRQALEKLRPSLDKKKARSRFDEALKKQEMGDLDGALELFAEAVTMDPNIGEYNYNFARLLFGYKNDYVKSKEYCLKSIEFLGDKPEVRILMGRIYKKIGMIKNATREFKLALKLDNENNDAKMELEELE